MSNIFENRGHYGNNNNLSLKLYTVRLHTSLKKKKKKGHHVRMNARCRILKRSHYFHGLMLHSTKVGQYPVFYTLILSQVICNEL